MVQTLLTWRWAAATLLLVAAVAVMVLLGRWQWERSVPQGGPVAVDLTDVTAADLPDVTDVAGPPGAGADVSSEVSGDLVRVSGQWLPDRTLLVADRTLPQGESPQGTSRQGESPQGQSEDAPGSWVVTGLELTDGSGVVPVVRGWVPAGPIDGSAAQQDAARELPTGPVDVVGWVQRSEPLDIPVEVVQPGGVVALLATADLANRWPEQLVPGFVVAAPTPAQLAVGGPTPLPAPPAEQSESRDWRNLAYSAQWFVFAAFAVVLWWRMLRDDSHRDRRAPADDELSRTGDEATGTETPATPVTQRSTT